MLHCAVGGAVRRELCAVGGKARERHAVGGAGRIRTGCVHLICLTTSVGRQKG